MQTSQQNGYSSASGIQELAQHSKILSEWSLNYNQLSKGKFRGDIQELCIDGIQIFKERISQSVFQYGESRADSFCFGVFDFLSGDTRWLGKSIETDDITWVPSYSELMLQTPEFSSLYGISIPNELISDLIDDSLLKNASCIKHAALSSQIRQQIDYMLEGMVQHPLSVITSHARQQFHSDVRGLVANFTDILVNGDQEQLHINRAQFIVKARKVVAMAHEAVLENAAEPLTVDDLCQLTYTSRRTLQNCFVTVTGQSPAAFLKNIRLNRVKKALAVNDISISISDTASQWGFWHLSQFTKDYKTLFGELPSETMQARSTAQKKCTLLM